MENSEKLIIYLDTFAFLFLMFLLIILLKSRNILKNIK